MKNFMAIIAVLAAATTARATVVNIDVQPSNGVLYSGLAAAPDPAGASALWNAAPYNTTVWDLEASNGSSTTIDFTISDAQGQTYINYQGDTSELTRDRAYKRFDHGDGVFGFTIEGLVGGGMYDIYLYGAYGVGSGQTDFAIGGVTKTAATESDPGAGGVWIENEHYVLFRGIVASGSGEIAGTVTCHDPFDDPNAPSPEHNVWGALAGVQIATVPEPNSVILFMLGLAGTAVCVRRR